MRQAGMGQKSTPKPAKKTHCFVGGAFQPREPYINNPDKPSKVSTSWFTKASFCIRAAR